jgi:hypothetical protein
MLRTACSGHHLPKPLLWAWLFLLFPFSLAAQEHPFLSVYTLTELDGAIRVDWTIQGGSTCDGQSVERSTDGVSFSTVHTIGGLCGDPNVPKSYVWTDEAPPELSIVHYRVKLGFDGYSSVKRVDFDQLTVSDQRFFPSPVRDEATLLLNLPNSASVDLLVFNARGATVLELTGHNGARIDLQLGTLPAGVYTYLAIASGRRFTGRFAKV